jgi:hypothetical protein
VLRLARFYKRAPYGQCCSGSNAQSQGCRALQRVALRLPMDCSQINDGVSVQPVGNATCSQSLLPSEERIISPGVLDRNHVSQPLVVLHQRFGSSNLFPSQKVH